MEKSKEARVHVCFPSTLETMETLELVHSQKITPQHTGLALL